MASPPYWTVTDGRLTTPLHVLNFRNGHIAIPNKTTGLWLEIGTNSFDTLEGGLEKRPGLFLSLCFVLLIIMSSFLMKMLEQQSQPKFNEFSNVLWFIVVTVTTEDHVEQGPGRGLGWWRWRRRGHVAVAAKDGIEQGRRLGLGWRRSRGHGRRRRGGEGVPHGRRRRDTCVGELPVRVCKHRLRGGVRTADLTARESGVRQSVRFAQRRC